MIEIQWPASGASSQPVFFPAPPGAPAGEALQLRAAGGDETAPAQRLADGRIVALVMPRAGGHRYELAAGSGEAGVSARRVDGDRVELKAGDSLFGHYHFGREFARPFIYPVHGPDGAIVTRHYPMREVAGESRDHPHHRSFWTAYGEVNDTDNWSEGKGHAFIRHVEFAEAPFGGPVCGGFTARNRWVDRDERLQLEERRAVLLFQAGPDRRLLDYTLTFTAPGADVTFGDTKEGGLISFRVATPMDGARGGRIENAEGGRGERECWGRPSVWCDYSGTVEGKTVGIAVLDHPENLRHPTRWHVRDYGLMTANPFGTSTFEGRESEKKGRYTLKAGQSLTFRYRVLIHRGDAAAGRAAEAWEAYSRPATVR